jgi:hypothetical protein
MKASGGDAAQTQRASSLISRIRIRLGVTMLPYASVTASLLAFGVSDALAVGYSWIYFPLLLLLLCVTMGRILLVSIRQSLYALETHGMNSSDHDNGSERERVRQAQGLTAPSPPLKKKSSRQHAKKKTRLVKILSHLSEERTGEGESRLSAFRSSLRLAAAPPRPSGGLEHHQEDVRF